MTFYTAMIALVVLSLFISLYEKKYIPEPKKNATQSDFELSFTPGDERAFPIRFAGRFAFLENGQLITQYLKTDFTGAGEIRIRKEKVFHFDLFHAGQRIAGWKHTEIHRPLDKLGGTCDS